MRLIYIFILIGISFGLNAQSPLSRELSDDFQEDYIDPDSVDYDSYTKKTSSFKALFNGKPGRAILYGMLIPGGGQMYNKDYWKVPIAWAAEGAGLYTFLFYRNQFREFDKAYRTVLMGGEAEYRGVTEAGSLFNFRTRFQKTSEQAGVAMVVIHILVAVESYIDRHLSVFDIDENLSLEQSAPGILPDSRTAGISLTYKF